MTPPTGWHDFAVMTGGASGALTGQLLVAVSPNAGRIEERRALRASAAQTLVLFLVPLVMAMVLLAPGHVGWVMGCELIAAGLGATLSLLAIGQRKRGVSDDDKWLASIFDRRDTNAVVTLLFVASGAVVAVGADAGLYLLLPASLVAFVSGVLNAWKFLIPRPDGHCGRRPGRRPRKPCQRCVTAELTDTSTSAGAYRSERGADPATTSLPGPTRPGRSG